MFIPLLSLDPSKLRLLRSEKYADLKNELMMQRLSSLQWFLDYRERLRKYRSEGGDAPRYPSKRVEEVERAVDDVIVRYVDPSYER